MAENLLRRGELWFVRVSIPADLRDFFGKNEFKVSLRTDSKVEAQLSKLPYVHEFKKKIKEAREKIYKENNEAFENITDKNYEDLIEQLSTGAKKLRELRDERIKEHFFNVEKIDYEKLQDDTSFLLEKAGFYANKELVSKFSNNVYKDFASKFNKQIRDSTINVHEYYDDMCMFTLKMIYECIINEIDSNKKKSLIIDIEEKKEEFYKAVHDEEYKIKVRSDFNDSRIKKYRDYAINVKEKTVKTVDSEISAIRKFNRFIESNKIEIMTFRNVNNYISNNFENKSLKTKKLHVLALNAIFKYLMKYDDSFIDKYEKLQNPFINHEFGGKNKVESYVAFEKEDIVKILEATKNKGDEDLYDLIKIASYTGCRREEILRLKVDDIVIKNGIKCFDIKKAKTKAGVRLVPMHPKLFDIIEKRSLNKNKDEFLFNTASKGKYNVRSELFSKRFTRLKSSMGYEKRHTFHSIRSTVITTLQNEIKDRVLIMTIVGHLTHTVTYDIYSEGATVENKFEAIQKLSY